MRRPGSKGFRGRLRGCERCPPARAPRECRRRSRSCRWNQTRNGPRTRARSRKSGDRRTAAAAPARRSGPRSRSRDRWRSRRGCGGRGRGSETSLPGILMPALMDNSEDEDFLIIHAIIDLEGEHLDTDLSDVLFNERRSERVTENLLKPTSDAIYKIFPKSRLLALVVTFCVSEVRFHRRIEFDPSHRSENSSSREIGLVFPAL